MSLNKLKQKTKTKPKASNFKQSNISKRAIIVFALIFALIGGYAIYRSFASTPPDTGITTANVWLSPNGSDSGSNCRFSSSPVSAPSASTACLTFDQADSLAQGGGNNEVVGVIPGNYSGSGNYFGFSTYIGNHGTNSVTFDCQSGASSGSVTFQDDAMLFFEAQDINFSGSCFHFHVMYAGLPGYSYPDNSTITGPLNFNGVHMDAFDITGTKNVTIQNSQIGPLIQCYAPGKNGGVGECQTTGPLSSVESYWASQTGGCGGTSGIQGEPFVHNNGNEQALNTTFDHDLFYGMNSADTDINGPCGGPLHQGGLLVWGTNGLTIENSTFQNNTIYDIEYNAGTSESNSIVQNNVFGYPVNSNEYSNSLTPPDWNTCEEGIGSGGSTFSNILYRYNTFAKCESVGGLGTQSYSNVRFVGNLIGGDASCNSVSGVTYAYNVVGNGGSCGSGATISGSPFNNYAANDYTLPAGSAAINYVPCSSGDLQLNFDINGNGRPASGNTNCTAGAYEYGSSGGSTPAPTVSISANPSSVNSGSSSTLTWSSSNATSCVGSGAWSGSKAMSGSASTGNLTTSSTYTLSCNGAGGTTQDSTTVTVNVAGAFNIGETTILPTADNGNSNLLVAQSAVLSQTATIQSLSFYVTNAAGKLRLGIYDASGPSGGPGSLKAQTAEITPTTGWNTANVTSQVSLSPGTYWLAYLPSDDNLAFVKTADSSSSSSHYSYTYGPMPATFSTTPASGPSHWSFYATLSAGGGTTLTGDTNGDGHVTITDLSTVLSHFGQSGQTLATGDTNGDGSVTIADLSAVLSHFGQ